MPRINYLRTKGMQIAEASRQIDKIGFVIRGHANAEQIGKSELVSMSACTARKRLANPKTLSIEELIQICIAYDIPSEDVLSKINW